MLFSFETKGSLGKNFLLSLEKDLKCPLAPEMELKVEKNLIFKILNKIKGVGYI